MLCTSKAFLFLRPAEIMEKTNFLRIKSIFYTFRHASVFQFSEGIQDTTCISAVPGETKHAKSSAYE